MTEVALVPRLVVVGNGTRGPYTLSVSGSPITYAAGSELVLSRYDDTDTLVGVLILNTDYTLSVDAVETGDAAATFTLASTEDVLASDESIVVERVTAKSSNFQLQSTGGIFEAALDKVTRLIQEANRDVSRRAAFHPLHSGSTSIPAAESGAFLGWSSGGELTNLAGVSDVAVSTAMEAVLAAASLQAAVTALGMPVYYAVLNGVSTSASDNTAALNALYTLVGAAGGGVIIYPDGTITCTGQVTCNASGITHIGQGMRQTVLHSTYTSGPAFVIGGSTNTTDYLFKEMRFTGVASQTFFWTKYVNNVFLERCSWSVDRILRIGDSSLGTGKPTYKVHILNCNECNHLTGGTPTLNHITVENLAGQWSFVNSFVEGGFSSTLDGFYASDNIQQKIDHVTIIGGVFSRFRDNYSFMDARVVNFFMTNHVSERAYRNAVRIEVTTSTAKSAANVGCENIAIDGLFSADTSNALYIKNERGSAGLGEITFGKLLFSSDNTRTPIYIECLVSGGGLEKINIGSINTQFTPTDTSQRIVHIVGGSASTTIRSVCIGPVVGRALTNALSSVIRVEGRIGEISYGLISFINATIAIDDQTSTTPLKLTATTAASSDLVNILDQSAAWMRPMLLSELAKALESYLTKNGSATYDPGSLADGAGVTTTVTATGAALGDFAEASFSLDLQGITMTAYVSAADTVSVRFQNETTGTIDLASGTLRVRTRPASLA